MRVLVLGAGGPAGVNFCRAARDGGHHVIGVDINPHHLLWAAEVCDEAHLCDSAQAAVAAHADEDTLVHAQPEPAVQWLADHDISPAIKFVPSMQTVALCRDKFECGLVWRRAGLREDRVELVDSLTTADHLTYPAWIRARHGAGAQGAILATKPEEAWTWISFWAHKQPSWEFLAEEHLPGRDYCWSSLWVNGDLVSAFARERVEWMYPHLAPSGRTGTPTVSVTVHDQDVNEMATAAVRAVSAATGTPAHGIFCVDLREDWEGVPRPTEINAGRWATTSPIHAPQLVDDQIHLAFGEQVPPRGQDCVPARRVLLRHIDCPTLHVEEPCLVS